MRWNVKNIIIWAVCLLGVLFALPNLFSPATVAKWPGFIPKQQVTLGLDLQGGSYLLLEVETDKVIEETLNNTLDSVRKVLRDQRAGYTELNVKNKVIQFQLRDISSETNRDLNKISELQNSLRQELGNDYGIMQEGKSTFRIEFDPAAETVRRSKTIDQSIEVVRRRVDETGVREPTIQRQGENRIMVQLPGEGDPSRIKALLGKTAKLTFQLVDSAVSVEEARRGNLPIGSMIVPGDHGGEFVVRRQAIITGDMLVDAQPTFQDNQPVVSFRFDARGAKRFAQTTTENVGKPFAIILDGKVISAPVIRQPITGGSGVISGSFTTQSAHELAVLLRAGALPAPLTVLEERSVGPELGRDSIAAGLKASLVGFGLVAAFMIICYGLFGIFSVIALIINVILIFAVLSFFGATLTLPGIAGIILTIGMAVDANVLIFERMREETDLGRTPMAAIEAGYKQAMGTITDANLTTLIATIMLYIFGSGPVRGFGVTLTIGIIASMFTAIIVTRQIVNAWARKKRPAALPL
ncbi:MAG: protein translocase subunit SecD [Dongiaceae bacterium]